MNKPSFLKITSLGSYYLVFIVLLLQPTIYSVVKIGFQSEQKVLILGKSKNDIKPGCDQNTLSQNKLENYITHYDKKLKSIPRTYRKCSQEFGTELIYSWRNTRIDLCSGGMDSGQITCFRRNAYEIPRMLCEITNSKMRMHEPFLTYDTPDLSIDSLKRINGSILEIQCNPSIYRWIPKEEWVQTDGVDSQDHFLRNPIKFLSKGHGVRCKSYVNHTVFWLNRWAAINAYHIMEDLVTTFESLLVLGEDPENVEIALYDGYIANNQFVTPWKDLFGKGLRIIRENPFPKHTCFKKSILNMYALRSHLTQNLNHAKPAICQSPILQGFRDWVWNKFNLDPEQSAAETTINRTIMFISRKTRTRRIQNEVEIFREIQSTFPNWNLRIFEPENLATFREQVESVYRADILIGVHGAGLTLSMFMSPGMNLIEIFMDDRGSGSMHYRSIAKWTGLNYKFIENNYTGTIPVADVISVIGETIAYSV